MFDGSLPAVRPACAPGPLTVAGGCPELSSTVGRGAETRMPGPNGGVYPRLQGRLCLGVGHRGWRPSLDSPHLFRIRIRCGVGFLHLMEGSTLAFRLDSAGAWGTVASGGSELASPMGLPIQGVSLLDLVDGSTVACPPAHARARWLASSLSFAATVVATAIPVEGRLVLEVQPDLGRDRGGLRGEAAVGLPRWEGWG